MTNNSIFNTISFRRITLLFFFLIALISFSSCSKGTSPKKKLKKEVDNKYINLNYDLKQIKEAGVLRIITTYSPTGYFLYRGETMGFEYELFNRLADYLGVNLEVVLAKNVDSVIPMLNRGDGDIIALGFTITGKRKEDVSFTDPYLITHQSLVQRKPDKWRKMTVDNIKKQLATDIVDLIHDTVSVREKSSYYERVKELSNELGDTIYIHILPGDMVDEEIIKQVSEGKIKYTVIDNNKAKIHQSYFPNIDINTPVSLSQRIAWAVRKDSKELLDTINFGLKQIKRSPDYNVIYKKYFENSRRFNKRMGSEYFAGNTGKISKYDDLVKENAEIIGLDWRLIKSMVYQESKFNTKNESWVGAEGLMQLMPATARELGVTNANDPKQNIKAGIKYLKRMYDYWDNIPDSIQRIKFAMASYNCGYGHVKDAQKLAIKFKKDSLSWDDGVDEFVLKLSKPEYYNDPVTKYGYARGSEPYNYVNDIFERYTNYKTIVHK